MKRNVWPVMLLIVVLAACQSKEARVTILDGANAVTLTTGEQLPAALLAEAKINLGPADRVYYRGYPTPLDAVLRTLQTHPGRPVLVLGEGGLEGMITLENLAEFIELAKHDGIGPR